MAKEGISDKVIDLLHKRTSAVRKKLEAQFKGVKPFRTEPLSSDEELFYYTQLSPEDMTELIRRHGPEKMNNFIAEMEQRKGRL